MLLSLPFAAYVSLFWFFESRYTSQREAALVGAAWWTLALVAITEVLSVGHAITQPWLAASWFCVTALTLALALLRRKAQTNKTSPGQKLLTTLRSWQRPDWVMATGVLCISLLIGVTALVSPPNGSDQLQYHLPRVVEWASRHSVAFFPTHYYVQLFAPPLAEWTALHSYVLIGGDRFVGLVQWFAFLGSALTVSLIAKQLGTPLRGQTLAALLCVTLPQGILAASGAKNDWVLAFWLAATVFFLLRSVAEPGWLNSCNTGLAAGAALLAKGSVYAFLPPIFLALLVCGLRRKWTLLLRGAPVAITLLALMNAAQWSRNYSLSGSVLGPATPDVAGKEKYTVDRISVAGVASNIVRELSMHVGTSVESINQRETKLARAIISKFGVNPDDRALTNYSNFEIPHSYFGLDEYYAGNPLHLLLIAIAFAALVLARGARSLMTTAIAVGIVGGFVLYCSVFKWEIWCARLHLPLFVLASAVVAVVLCERMPRALPPVTVLALFLAAPPTLMNSMRPLLFTGGLHNWSSRTSILLRSRPELYFTQQQHLMSTYIPAATFVRSTNCNDVGIDTSVRPYAHEYPLMELGRTPNQEKRFRYIDVHNLSSKYANTDDLLDPCLVICPDCLNHSDKWKEYLPALPLVRTFGDMVVFTRIPRRASSSN